MKSFVVEVLFDVAVLAVIGLLVAGTKHVHGGKCAGEAGHGFPPSAEASHR